MQRKLYIAMVYTFFNYALKYFSLKVYSPITAPTR